MAAQYNSWTLPFSMLLGVPIAIFGAFAALYLRGLDNDVYAQIGLVMLIGLSAKNARSNGILPKHRGPLKTQQGLCWECARGPQSDCFDTPIKRLNTVRLLRQRKCDQSDGTFLIRIGRFIIAARIARCTEQQVLTAIKFVRRR